MNKTLIALILAAMVPLTAAADMPNAGAERSLQDRVAELDCFRAVGESRMSNHFIPPRPVRYICEVSVASDPNSRAFIPQKLMPSEEDYENWVLEWEALSADPRIVEAQRQKGMLTDRNGQVIVGPITEAIIKRNIAKAQSDIADWIARNPFTLVNQVSKRELESKSAQNCEAIKLDAKLATAIIDPIRREAMLKTKRSGCESSRDKAVRELETRKKQEAERLERARNPWQIEPL